VDLVAIAFPEVIGMAERLKTRLAGRSVGHFDTAGNAHKDKPRDEHRTMVS
jgi:hypothetical protein